MSLLTENNRQYYEGAQSFTADGINQSFTTTFDTDLIFYAASSATDSYTNNNFKLYTSPNGGAGSYTEYTDPYTVSGNTINITGLQFSSLNSPVPSFVSYVDITKDAFSSTIILGDTVSIPFATWDGTGSVGATTSAVISTIIDNGTEFRLIWSATTYGNARYGLGTQVSINPLANGTQIVVQLKKIDGGNYGNTANEKAYGSIVEENYGSYSYTKLHDIINNFQVAYVGVGKLLQSVKRTDVIFHAKRAMQEFSYDTLKSVNSQELTVPQGLSIPLPQDYVNYVNIYWVDQSGRQHIIMPTNTLHQSPTELPVQDTSGVPIQDSFDNNIDSGNSIIDDRWANNGLRNTGNLANDSFAAAEFYSDFNNMVGYGQQYGLDPQYANVNGYFNINDRLNSISFSNNLVDKIINFEYISDGLSNDLNTRVPKMAEEAMYAYILHAIIASRINQPEYVVQRLKREKSAKLRNAKIRLSNIKLNEFVQVMRGKSKWIKH